MPSASIQYPLMLLNAIKQKCAKDDEFSNVKIVINDKTFKFNGQLLSVLSDYFDTFLNNEMSSVEQSSSRQGRMSSTYTIEIPKETTIFLNMDYDFNDFINYILGEDTINDANCIDFLILFDYFLLQDEFNIYAQKILFYKNINFSQLIEFNYYKNDENLNMKINQYIFSNYTKLDYAKLNTNDLEYLIITCQVNEIKFHMMEKLKSKILIDTSELTPFYKFIKTFDYNDISTKNKLISTFKNSEIVYNAIDKNMKATFPVTMNVFTKSAVTINNITIKNNNNSKCYLQLPSSYLLSNVQIFYKNIIITIFDKFKHCAIYRCEGNYTFALLDLLVYFETMLCETKPDKSDESTINLLITMIKK
jgi:hypothetical protein